MATLLCRIVWAENYRGEKDFYAGHMEYPAKHKVAHEILNFANENGVAYGFVENKGDWINLGRLGIKNEATADGVTVIWCAVDKDTQCLRVVGWYEDATVCAEPQKTKRISKDGEWTYQFKTEFRNAHLIPVSERDLEVPRKRKLGLQEIEWVFSATSERWEHACEHLEPQIFLVA